MSASAEFEPRQKDERRKSGGEAAQRVDQNQPALHRHAGKPRRHRIGPDHRDLLAPDAALREQRADEQQRGHEEHRDGNADEIAVAELAEASGEAVDRAAGHERVGQSLQHPQHAVGRDEGGNAQQADHHAVQQADRGADRQRRRDAEPRIAGGLDHRPRQAGGQTDRRADGEVEPGGDHHKRQAGAHEEQQRGLAQHVDQIDHAQERAAENAQGEADDEHRGEPQEQANQFRRKGGARRRGVAAVMAFASERLPA